MPSTLQEVSCADVSTSHDQGPVYNAIRNMPSGLDLRLARMVTDNLAQD